MIDKPLFYRKCYAITGNDGGKHKLSKTCHTSCRKCIEISYRKAYVFRNVIKLCFIYLDYEKRFNISYILVLFRLKINNMTVFFKALRHLKYFI